MTLEFVQTPLVAVLGSSQTRTDHGDFREGRLLGRELAKAGLAVATGGYGGLMEAVSLGAAEAGAEVIGVTAPTVFPMRPGPNPHVTLERPAATIAERIRDLLDPADAVVALPGSIGTFTELVMAWNMAFVAQFGHRDPPLVVAVGSLWSELVPYLAERIQTDAGLVHCVSNASEAAALVIETMSTRSS